MPSGSLPASSSKRHCDSRPQCDALQANGRQSNGEQRRWREKAGLRSTSVKPGNKAAVGRKLRAVNGEPIDRSCLPRQGSQISQESVAGIPRGRRVLLVATLNERARVERLGKMVQNRTKKFEPGHIRQPRPELQRGPRPPQAEAVRWVSTLNAFIAHRTARALM